MTDKDDELDGLLRAYRALSLAQRERLVQRIIERAKAERAQALRALFRRLRNWIVRRRAIGRLQRLDDRMLKDIGLHRSEIAGAVDERRRFDGRTTGHDLGRPTAVGVPATNACLGKAA